MAADARQAFPRSIDDVTAGWLRERLLEADVSGAGTLTAFEASPVPKQGMSSAVHVLTLRYDGTAGNAPPKVLAKFASEIEPVKKAFAANRGFEREVTFYNHFGRNAGLPIPRCYWAAYDAPENRCGFLLEHCEGCRQTDVFTGETRDVERVVDVLAPFHARWWNRRADLEVLPEGQAPFMIDLVLTKLPAALETITSKYRDEVGPTLVALLELWIPHAHRFAALERAKPQTLCHGDFHREQILFPDDPSAPPIVIDWQLAGRDTGIGDLAHLLMSGLRPEQRAGAECAMVARYHEALVRHGVPDYPIDELWASYRYGLARLAMFYMTAFAMGDIGPTIAWWDSDEKRKGFPFWDVICRWTTETLDEHGVVERLRRLV